MAQQKLSDTNRALSGRLYHTHGNINKLSCCLVVLLSGCFVVWLFCCFVVGSFGWKPIPSEARVTGDEVSGIKKVRESCQEDSTTLLCSLALGSLAMFKNLSRITQMRRICSFHGFLLCLAGFVCACRAQ